MVRRVEEPIEVRPDEPGDVPPGASPEHFVWRGRLYQVTSVVEHWQERSPWWRATAEGVPLDVAGAPRQIWRVAARAGRSGPEGVYDLDRDPSRQGGLWSLLRTQD